MIKYTANIGVFSKSLTVVEIEKILRISCDGKREIGQPRVNHKNCILRFDENVWLLHSDIDSSLPLDKHIENILQRIRPNAQNFSFLKNCEVMCECIIEGNEEDGIPEINLPNHLIKELASINAGIDVDLHVL